MAVIFGWELFKVLAMGASSIKAEHGLHIVSFISWFEARYLMALNWIIFAASDLALTRSIWNRSHAKKISAVVRYTEAAKHIALLAMNTTRPTLKELAPVEYGENV